MNIVNNNLCERCSGTYVENEFHLLFRSKAFDKLRKTFIPEYYRKQPSIEKTFNAITN